MSAATQDSAAANSRSVLELISAVELQAVRCHKLQAEILQDIDLGEMLNLAAKCQYTIGRRIAQDKKSFDVRITLTVDGARQGDTTDAPIVRILSVYELRYGVKASGVSLTHEAVQQFAESNGVFNAWPFLRESIHSSCVRLGIAPVILGLLRIDTNAGLPLTVLAPQSAHESPG